MKEKYLVTQECHSVKVIHIDKILSVALVYLYAPILIFFITWFKLQIGVPLSICLIYAILVSNKYVDVFTPPPIVY